MHIRPKLNVCLAALLVSAFALSSSNAQTTEPYKATLAIRLDQPRAVINRNIYGQFAEHLGRLIYDGTWVGENSPIPNKIGEHTSELQSPCNLVCRLLLEKKNTIITNFDNVLVRLHVE